MDGGDKVEKATVQDCRLEKPKPRPQAAIGFIRHVCILAEESNLVESWPFCENKRIRSRSFKGSTLQRNRVAASDIKRQHLAAKYR